MWYPPPIAERHSATHLLLSALHTRAFALRSRLLPGYTQPLHMMDRACKNSSGKYQWEGEATLRFSTHDAPAMHTSVAAIPRTADAMTASAALPTTTPTDTAVSIEGVIPRRV